MKYGGKTTHSAPFTTARRRPPRAIVEPGVELEHRGEGGRIGVVMTGRTTPKGWDAGRRQRQPSVQFAKHFDGSVNTIEPVYQRDKMTGLLNGIKIAPCRACGHQRRVQVATGLCGVGACRRRRQRQYEKRLNRAKAKAWVEQS